MCRHGRKGFCFIRKNLITAAVTRVRPLWLISPITPEIMPFATVFRDCHYFFTPFHSGSVPAAVSHRRMRFLMSRCTPYHPGVPGTILSVPLSQRIPSFPTPYSATCCFVIGAWSIPDKQRQLVCASASRSRSAFNSSPVSMVGLAFSRRAFCAHRGHFIHGRNAAFETQGDAIRDCRFVA